MISLPWLGAQTVVTGRLRMTFNSEFKSPAGAVLMWWGKPGISALVEAAFADTTTKNVSICLDVLASGAGGLPSGRLPGSAAPEAMTRIGGVLHDPEVVRECRRRLVEVVLSLPDDEIVLHAGLKLMQAALLRESQATELVRAYAARWLALGKPVLDQFRKLIRESSEDEPAFQQFLTRYPQLLDPLASAV